MRYFPVHLNLKGKKVVVLGQGAEPHHGENFDQKIRRLEAVGAKVLTDFKGVDGVFLVMILSKEESLIHQGLQEAGKFQSLVYVENRPDLSDFILPAIVERGDFVITVSTGGASPALAKKIRQELESQFGEEYAEQVRRLGEMRRQGVRP